MLGSTSITMHQSLQLNLLRSAQLSTTRKPVLSTLNHKHYRSIRFHKYQHKKSIETQKSPLKSNPEKEEKCAEFIDVIQVKLHKIYQRQHLKTEGIVPREVLKKYSTKQNKSVKTTNQMFQKSKMPYRYTT